MDRMKSFDAWVEAFQKEYDVPGIAIAAVNSKGETLYQRFLGVRNHRGDLMDENTIFGMASLTKAFTDIAIMQLAERKIVDINAPVARYLPAIKDEHIMVWHLMSHCAGYYPMARMLISDVAKDLGIYEEGRAELAFSSELAEEGCRRVIERMNQQKRRLGEPGQYMSYCNDGYGLLSEIVRRYGGEDSFAKYLNKYILNPLGMARSGCEFIKPLADENCTDLFYKENGQIHFCRDFYRLAFVLHGGGALRSTIHDMKLYMTMLLNKGVSLTGTCIVSEESILSMMKGRFEDGPGIMYGRGFAEEKLEDGTSIYGHAGSLVGISNHILWSPKHDVGILVFCNLMDVAAHDLARQAITAYTGCNFKKVKPQHWSEADIQAVLGEYQSGEGAHVILTREADGTIVVNTGDGLKTPCVMMEGHTITIGCAMFEKHMNAVFDENGQLLGLRVDGRIVPKIS